LAFEKIFDESYERVKLVTKDGDSFFEAFYNRFISSDPEIAAHFDETDMTQQKQMVERSFYRMLAFYTTNQDDDYMRTIAYQHSTEGFNVDPKLYDIWLGSLVDTVKEYDPEINSEIELAWRLIMSSGITYMKHHYDR
jgi:hemoglobin-like flavoprotein